MFAGDDIDACTVYFFKSEVRFEDVNLFLVDVEKVLEEHPICVDVFNLADAFFVVARDLPWTQLNWDARDVAENNWFPLHG